MMLKKLSRQAEAVVRRARKIAHEYQNEYVGTEHILLALAEIKTGLVHTIFAKHDLSAATLRDEVDELAPQNPEETWVFGQLPGTPHLKSVIVEALETARRLRSERVEPEHILLALLSEEGSVAHLVLSACAVDVAAVRKTLADSVRESRRRKT